MNQVLLISGSKVTLPYEPKEQYLTIMKALLKVLESSNPSPNDINTLMVFTRELMKRIPDGSVIPFGFGSELSSLGLKETGDIIVYSRGIPHIITKMGK